GYWIINFIKSQIYIYIYKIFRKKRGYWIINFIKSQIYIYIYIYIYCVCLHNNFKSEISNNYKSFVCYLCK
ncbi:MAG: hypothetical protein N7Q72_07360, partial [Spiroplasma sp. Tabriz.8]|nr:hypothetical protein [Spiroplasma sp. Tabriz.8]